MIIKSRAPLRLGLAGGGTDVSPFCDIYTGHVLNATIDRYAYTVIEILASSEVVFVAEDLQQTCTINPERGITLDGKLDLHKAVYREIMNQYNHGQFVPIKLTTFCDAPPGSGLGSSSTLVVSMLKAFVELLNLPLDDYGVAQLAFKIEREICQLKGGRQDQYSATFGGFNFMEFYEGSRTIVNPLRIKNWIRCELEASLILFYTGVSRSSAQVIEDQSNNIKKSEQVAVEAMHGIKKEATDMKECLLKGDFSGIVESMRNGWENKKRSATAVSNSYIDEIYDCVIKSGALAGKVSGAGGGGFMMFFVSSQKRMDVIRTLDRFNGQVSNCHFTESGMQAWRIV